MIVDYFGDEPDSAIVLANVTAQAAARMINSETIKYFISCVALGRCRKSKSFRQAAIRNATIAVVMSVRQSTVPAGWV